MNIKTLLAEYDLEIDDVRWYLASSMAGRLLQYRDQPFRLIKYIWSGVLEDELYDMEERYLSRLQADHDQGYTDEGRIREIMSEVAAARSNRYSQPWE